MTDNTTSTPDLVVQYNSAGQERILTGHMPAKGSVRIGRAFIINDVLPNISRDPITDSEIEFNIQRLNDAIEESKKQFQTIKNSLTTQPIEVRLQLREIIEVQETALSGFKRKIISKIENGLMNAEAAIVSHIEDIENMFTGKMYAHVVNDMHALGGRLIRNMLEQDGNVLHASLDDAPERSFVIANKLAPSDCIYLVAKNIRGLIIEHGSASGHVGVIAKELGIPCIFTGYDVGNNVHDDMPVIIDGQHGKAYLNPSKETIEKYAADFEKEGKKTQRRKKYKGKKIQSKDGVDCMVLANINVTHSANRAKENVSDGIGLYRTELLFTSGSSEPSIEDQRDAYGYVIKAVDGHATTFRLLDIEGDKKENNWIKHEEIWNLRKNQVKAIMLAAADNNTAARILLPVVRDIDELTKVRGYIEQARQELEQEGITPPDTKLGMMVEIPAPAAEIEDYIDHADFFSIGSNDLIAWTCGQIRADENYEEYEDPTNRTVLKTLEHVIKTVQKSGKTVSLCGRIASNPKYVSLLMGLGLKKFSAGVENVLDIKEMIEKIDVGAARQMVEQLKLEPSRTKREEILYLFNGKINQPNMTVKPTETNILR